MLTVSSVVMLGSILRMAFSGLMTTSSSLDMRRAVSAELHCRGAIGALVDMRSILPVVSRETAGSCARDAWRDAIPVPYVPVALLVQRSYYDTAANYCGHMVSEGFARAAFVSEDSALRWLEKRLYLGGYEHLPR
jgi:hypothetical protein